ncbi:tRNA (N6-threonylcarbamoyladenosine(37)-N6)-methyltransferase TrmO [Rhodopseudomonas palustris]|uniref:tRNA (N6-threonylcarbamoyladenosine(37)-N6)-methyltransferase TrmO n=1 Tax=Rhodopseudomonas palustris TaxID=1076 RepID=UPI002ACEBA8D|nr:tRNA (N6-threonylcarbamoyladenosine(37)-N6)-methyltransferase TrmO [Rhodopseudomonas palustris]WQH01158.1 tRNA (N6-threonylcarbamoyladenosine(37)-N6)-methyltransferase TrmO [Rhodopseudomonas palustris]
MIATDDIREGEVTVTPPPPTDAGLVFIGRIRTPWRSRGETPRQGSPDGPVCRLEIFEPWTEALTGLDKFTQVQVVYWLHQARRDLVIQRGHGIDGPRGTFALRSPLRPNPIGISAAALVGIEGTVVLVRGLDCLDGTPLIDLKPDRCSHSMAK